MIFLILFVIDKLIKILSINSEGSSIVNFGILFGISLSPLIVLIITIIISAFIFCFYKNIVVRSIPIKIIALGAIMNITDRFIWGGVIDYFNVFGILTINLADVIILIGIIYLIYSKYISEKKNLIKS